MLYSLLDRIIFRLTARRWNRLINNVLCHHYSLGTINSAQLHELAAEFDPTQRAAYKRLVPDYYGGSGKVLSCER